MIVSMSKKQLPWYEDGLSFTCTQCGNCCTGPTGYVWFTEDEAEAMAAELGLSVEEFKERYVEIKHGRESLREVPRPNAANPKRTDYDCVFLVHTAEGKRICSVYESRPTQCRTWPFWESNLHSPRHWNHAGRSCPGMPKADDDHRNNGKQFVPVEQIRVITAKNPDGL